MGASPLAQVDLNIVRQNSKSSNFSANSKKPSPSSRASHVPAMATSTSGNAAVLSMLKTTTETGDLGSFTMGSGKLPKLPRGLNRHPTNTSGTMAHSNSRASSRYSRNGSTHESIRSIKSQRSGREGSIPGAWPYGQHQYSLSQDFPRPPSEARSSVAQGSVRSGMIPGYDRFDTTERSHSLTRALQHPRAFSDNRSLSSLRSQEHAPRPESPFVQANRFQRASRRPSSPARSDAVGSIYYERHGARPKIGSRAHTAMALPPQYPSDFPQTHDPTYRPVPQGRLRFRPSRTIEDLKKPFIVGGQSNGNRSGDRPIQSRMPQPLPAQYRQFNHGPPLPHIRMTNGTAQSPYRDNHSEAPVARSGPPNTAPYMGFVQRVRTALEERTSTEELRARSPNGHTHQEPSRRLAEITPRKPSPHEPVVVVPASVDDKQEDMAVAEGELVPIDPAASPSLKRLTRDMIKAGMDAMSDVVPMSDVAEEAMTTSIRNVDSYNHSKSSSIENKSGRASAPSDHSSISASVNEDVEPRKKGTPQMTEEHLSSSSTADPIHFTLRMSRPKANEMPRPNTNAGPSPQATVLGLNPSMRLETPIFDSMGMASFTRHSSAPQQASQESTMPRNAAGKSLPVVASTQQSNQRHRSTDSDGQKAIRLSSIGQKKASHSDNDAKAAIPRPNVPDTCDESTQLRSSIVVLPDVEEAESLQQMPSSACSSFSNANESTKVVHHSQESMPSASVDAAAIQAEGNASLMHASGNGLGSPPRITHHLAEARTHAMRNFHFPLPDLTEDSQEDASTTNLRILGMRAPIMRPRPPRDLRQQRPVHTVEPVIVPDDTPKSYLKRIVVDMHHLPSFNFSRVDLTTKLNNALGLRFSRSAGDLTELTSSSVATSLPDRPMSQALVRDTYRSFFMEGEVDVHEDEPGMAQSATRSAHVDEGLLDEIDKLDIPSVKHLTARLSELLPSIKQSRSEFDLELIDQALRETVVEIRQLGSLNGAETSNEKRKSMSTVAGRQAATSALDRQETISSRMTMPSASGVRRQSLLHLMKELPPLPTEGRYHRRDKSVLISARTSSSNSVARSTPGELSELEGTAVEVTGSTTPEMAAEHNSDKARRADSVAKAKVSPSPGTTPRPWNKNESYPWATEAPPVDINISSSGSQHEAARAQQESRLRLTRPSADSGGHDPMRIVRSMSPGFPADPVPATDLPDLVESRDSSRNGLLGNMARKMGLKPRYEKAGFAVDRLFFHPEEHSVGAGDRYPTTSLSSPVAGLNLDEGRSFFSDDSSLSEHTRAGLRKRLTRLRPRLTLPNVGSPAASPAESRTDVNHVRPDGDSSTIENHLQPAVHRNIVAANEPLAVGMSKTEFKAKRLVEKIRTMLYKSSHRLRHVGKNKRRDPLWHDAVEVQPRNA